MLIRLSEMGKEGMNGGSDEGTWGGVRGVWRGKCGIRGVGRVWVEEKTYQDEHHDYYNNSQGR